MSFCKEVALYIVVKYFDIYQKALRSFFFLKYENDNCYFSLLLSDRKSGGA